MRTSPSTTQVLARRQAAGLTQAQAAALLYRSARNWQQWELGERAMDPALWELFCLKAPGGRSEGASSKEVQAG